MPASPIITITAFFPENAVKPHVSRLYGVSVREKFFVSGADRRGLHGLLSPIGCLPPPGTPSVQNPALAKSNHHSVMNNIVRPAVAIQFRVCCYSFRCAIRAIFPLGCQRLCCAEAGDLDAVHLICHLLNLTYNAILINMLTLFSIYYKQAT
jgi:hypothetical protein